MSNTKRRKARHCIRIDHWMMVIEPGRCFHKPVLEIHALYDDSHQDTDPPLKVWKVFGRVMRVLAQGQSWERIKVCLKFLPSPLLYLRMESSGLRAHISIGEQA